MSDGYRLTPDDLVAHANDLGIFADQVRAAKARAADLDAYGVVGRVWSWSMAGWCDDAHAFVDRAAQKADDVAKELAAMARTYADQEQAATDNLRGAGGDGQ